MSTSHSGSHIRVKWIHVISTQKGITVKKAGVITSAATAILSPSPAHTWPCPDLVRIMVDTQPCEAASPARKLETLEPMRIALLGKLKQSQL